MQTPYVSLTLLIELTLTACAGGGRVHNSSASLHPCLFRRLCKLTSPPKQKLEKQIRRCADNSSLVDLALRVHRTNAPRWSTKDRKRYTRELREILDARNGEREINASQNVSCGGQQRILLTPRFPLRRAKSISRLTYGQRLLKNALQ